MVANYLLREEELDEVFYSQLKQQFKNKRISLTVSEAIDETEYLLSNPANAKHLLDSIENSRNPNELVQISIADLKAQAGE